MRKLNIAIVGATGLVGKTFLKVLEEKKIKVQNLYLFASKKSDGKKVVFNGKDFFVLELNDENLNDKKIDYALFSAGNEVSKKYAPKFKKLGATVIDNSSAFRMEKDVPLVVPEVNFFELKGKKIISNPNCSTIQCMVPLKALDNLFKLKSVHFATYQAVSGSGQKGIEDLNANMKGVASEFYPYEIFDNCIPQIDSFLENGFTKEEIKMVNETRKILNLKNIKISATCVRVPIRFSHSVDIFAITKEEIDVLNFKKELKKFKNVKILDNPKKNLYPMPKLSTGKDDILVGRIRKDLFNKKAIHLFVVADNIRKGAASNAVEILEFLEQHKN